MRRISTLSLTLTSLLLLGIAAERSMQPRPADAEGYHTAVAAEIDAVPYRIGQWVGVDVEQPPAAVKLLNANRILSRRYRIVDHPGVVDLLIVHCRDARDLQGHYPPTCYPAHGWTAVSSEPKIYMAGPRAIPAVEYFFTQTLPERSAAIRIAGVLARPDGQYPRDMKGVSEMARDYQRRFYGAAQLQVLIHGDLSQEQRDAIANEFLTACGGVLDAIAQGAAP